MGNILYYYVFQRDMENRFFYVILLCKVLRGCVSKRDGQTFNKNDDKFRMDFRSYFNAGGILIHTVKKIDYFYVHR